MKKKIVTFLRKITPIKILLDYRLHIFYSVKYHLKKKTTGSYLSWLWLIFEPIFLTILYGVFISLFLKGGGLSFGAYILLGLMSMYFFQRSIVRASQLMYLRKPTIRSIRIPKMIFTYEVVAGNLVEFGISICLAFILLFIAGVHMTKYILFFPVILILLLILTIGFTSLALHLGYYIPDIQKILSMGFRLLFYASGTIFPIESVIHTEWMRIVLMDVNPIAFIMKQFRLITLGERDDAGNFLGAQLPDLLTVAIWFVIGIALIFLTSKLISRHEGKYEKNV